MPSQEFQFQALLKSQSMALVVSVSENKRTFMLQDYLRDDVNSCSSNGFRSFPRRHCCAAVKNILEKEFSRNARKTPAKRLIRRPTIPSVLHRASMAVVNAVKLIPFNKSTSPVSRGEGKRLLPRSFSKKLFRRRFWWSKKSTGKKKGDDECDQIGRWISSGVVCKETAVNNGSNSNSDGKSDCWSDVTFTSDCLTTSSENDAVERTEKLAVSDVAEVEKVSERNGEDSVVLAITKNCWHIEEIEKEQLSPISVMDFTHSDEGNSSPFNYRATRFKGSRERRVKKLGKFDSVMELGLQPINLEALLSSTLMEVRSPDLSMQPCSTPTFIISCDTEDEENKEEDDENEANSELNEDAKKVEALLKTLKSKMASTMASWSYEFDSVLQDYFRENVMESEEKTLLKVGEDWVNGHFDRLILGWEMKDKREAYIRDMEEGGRWPKEPKLHMEEVAKDVEALVLSYLVEEFLVECC